MKKLAMNDRLMRHTARPHRTYQTNIYAMPGASLRQAFDIQGKG